MSRKFTHHVHFDASGHRAKIERQAAGLLSTGPSARDIIDGLLIKIEHVTRDADGKIAPCADDAASALGIAVDALALSILISAFAQAGEEMAAVNAAATKH